MGGAIFSILIYVAIGYFVFRTIRKNRKGTTSSQTGPQANQVMRPQAVQSVPPRPHRKNNGVNAHMARERINIRGWEDRRNDWLARQMAEERAAARRMSEMFQMKLEHRYNCEAEMLKQFHEARCDANEVDTGEHK